jgi:hypothetical protein
MSGHGGDDVPAANAGLFGQSVLSKVSERMQAKDKERSNRLSFVLIAAVVGIPIIDFFDRHGSPARGDLGVCFLAVIGVIVWVRRDLRKSLWFWLSIAALGVMHLFAWLAIPVRWEEPRGTITVVGYSDLFVSVLVLAVLERRFGRRDEPDPDASVGRLS